MRTFAEWLDNKKVDSIKKLAKQYKVDLKGIDMKELLDGMQVEKEHDGRQGGDTDVVDSDADVMKIAVAHLREKKDYYKKLKKAGL
jgi:hypothetical protein